MSAITNRSAGQTCIARVQDCGVFPPHLRKHVALVQQKPVHIPDKAQVLLVSRGLTYCTPPFLDGLEYLSLHATRSYRWPFRKPSDELIEELFGADLEMEGVSAVLDADIE